MHRPTSSIFSTKSTAQDQKEDLMNTCLKMPLIALSLAFVLLPALQVSAQGPASVTNGTVVATFHAEGAQIYECSSDFGTRQAERALTWQFREPSATLILDGKSVGRHYAGPNWDHVDGSGVKGSVVTSAPGATSADIPWLNIDIIDHRNTGLLSDATTVRRINTKGGVAQGSCKRAGDYLSVPYSADYVFLRKGD
jgi:hypothetical protein